MSKLKDLVFVHDDGYHPKEDVLLVSDVKEFINKLKEANHSNFLYGKFADVIDEVIDKLSGFANSESSENYSPSAKDSIKEVGENRCNDLVNGYNVKDSVTRDLQVSNQCSSAVEYPEEEDGGSNPSTEDTLSENKVPTHKEFQDAIDKSGLRGYEFGKSELNAEDKE